MNRRASCVGTFEAFEAVHVALRTLLAFSQPVNCIFLPIGMLNWLVAASKLHKHRETCCTVEWPFYSFLILCLKLILGSLKKLSAPSYNRSLVRLQPLCLNKALQLFAIKHKPQTFLRIVLLVYVR